MIYITKYLSPLGGMTMASDGTHLTGLWFDGQKYFPARLAGEEKGLPLFGQVRTWLDAYFRGENPPVRFGVRAEGSPFRRAVWELLRAIPYGTTMTYGQLARALEERTGRRCAAQAVGGAVGHNPVSVVIPCHRVVGTDGSLMGYAGGTGKKYALLQLEGADMTKLHLPAAR